MFYFGKIVQSIILKQLSKDWKKIYSTIGIALLLSSLIAPVNANTSEEVLSIPTLDEPVEVIIDQWGIPHIYAESVTDAFTALGYLHAKDRLYQMYQNCYQAAGRLSEIEGLTAIESDKYYRTVGLPRAAEKNLKWFEENAETYPEAAYVLSLMDAEANGVNAYIDSLTSETMPREFRVLGFDPPHWTRLDQFLSLKIGEFTATAYYYYFYNQYIQDYIGNETMVSDLYPDQLPFIVPMITEQHNLSGYEGAPGGYKGIEDLSTVQPVSHSIEVKIPQSKLEALISWQDSVNPPYESVFSGSNCWVVDGSKSATGKPLLAQDPHSPLGVPASSYEAHIVVPGELNVAGLSYPGLPVIGTGHTEHVAWGVTTIGSDLVDVFVEEINPSNPDQYLYNDEWHDFEIREEIIHVKNGNDVRFSVKWSVHGPLIDSAITTFDLDVEDAPNLAMNWTGHSVTTSPIAYTLLNRAENIEDYFDALYYFDSFDYNVFYADDRGNIAVTSAGRFPVRSGYSGKYPVKATDDSIGVVGYIPYNYLPRSVNPSQHYLQSSNQIPIDPENYPYDIQPAYTDFDWGYRSRRANELLLNDDSISVEDLMVYQADSLDLRAQRIVPFVIDAWEDSGKENSEIQAIVDELGEWDYVMDTDDAMPTFWCYLLDSIRDLTFDEVEGIFWFCTPDDPVLEDFIVNNKPYYFDKQDTPSVIELRDNILVESIEAAYGSIVDDFGSNMNGWLWGNHHVVVLEHPGGFDSIEGGGLRGGDETINVAPTDWPDALTCYFGPVARRVVDLGNIENSYLVYPGGQSGDSSSPHWDDLFDLWYTFDEETQHYGYHKMYFYLTAPEFVNSDTDGLMIESVVNFAQHVETNTGEVTEEETDTGSNGWIPGFPVWSIGLAILLVSLSFYMKQHQ